MVTVVHGEAEAESECEGEGEVEGEGEGAGVALAPEARGEPEEEVEGVDPLSGGEWLLLCEAHALVPVAFGDRDVGEEEGGAAVGGREGGAARLRGAGLLHSYTYGGSIAIYLLAMA